MDRVLHRRSDPLNVNFNKSSRLINNDIGFFYKIRGGRLNGPFKTVQEANADLEVFKNVLAIEEQLDIENLHLFSQK